MKPSRVKVALPKEELAVEVGDVDSVHVNYVDVAETRKGEVLEQFATQATSAHAQNSAVTLEELANLRRKE